MENEDKDKDMFYSVNSEPIKDYPMYMINTNGDIVSSWRGKKLTHHDNGLGYMMVFLKKENGLGRWQYVHRLLAIQFIDIPYKLSIKYKPEELWVNHIDGNKSNNQLDNLEWTTINENIQHSYDVLKRKRISGKEHWNWGKKLSDETKKKQSEQKKGIKHPKFRGYYIMPDGTRYSSSYEAEEHTGIYAKKIYRYCHQNKNGYSFESI